MKQIKHCVLNVGHYRTGTTTLAQAAKNVGYKVHRAFFGAELGADSRKLLLANPSKAVWKWWTKENGQQELENLMLISKYTFICDGYIPWLIMLPEGVLTSFHQEMFSKGIHVHLVGTKRNVDTLLVSELHHWVVYDLEAAANLEESMRHELENMLRNRIIMHSEALERHDVPCLALEDTLSWPGALDTVLGNAIAIPKMSWTKALREAGPQNPSPRLPLQGILLTLRIGTNLNDVSQRVGDLLSNLKQDRICNMIVVLALDHDEADTPSAQHLVEQMRRYCPVHLLTNPANDPASPFPICRVWDRMAIHAFTNDCDWVMLLGDDITIECSFHYRAFYRAFLDISRKLKCPFGFGCPWWNDRSFKGFPTFPVIGKTHFEIFGSFIPVHRAEAFINQDLDPYIQRLYLKFGAAPLVKAARLANETGGNYVFPTRYQRIPAEGWRDWVLHDDGDIKKYLIKYTDFECILLDVVIPTYRLNLEYLERLCCLQVPKKVRTSFIIVVDNPDKLKAMYKTQDKNDAVFQMESYLAARSNNNIRVRCNDVNSGASATRIKGLDESAAEFVLLLDDDVIPAEKLLFQYEAILKGIETSTVGLVGMVEFPRRRDLPILHAAVLMSYLTFMFEIASNKLYECPAWGVTANLLVRRSKVRFDTVYAKTGGGEDVDFCLRLTKENGGRFMAAPQAHVTHDYWPGGLKAILPHFFKWAIGDGALYTRYPAQCFRSWPNAVESFCLTISLSLLLVFRGILSPVVLPLQTLGIYAVDVGLELFNQQAFEHRCSVVQNPFPLWYFVLAHLIANLYVITLEFGRLYGHVTRGELCQNACRRFEWHCGKLPMARERVVRREAIKFAGFLFVSALNMYACAQCRR